MSETIHLVEPGSPRWRGLIFACCGIAVDECDADRQRGERITCPECVRLERQDEIALEQLQGESDALR